MKRRAFTLIELLVVIAIIAILAAILFPVFARAKAAAKATSALSGTKQLVLACIMYQGDVDDYFPLGTSWNTGNDELCFSATDCFSTWAWNTAPYVKSIGLLSDTSGPQNPVYFGWNATLVATFSPSFGYNYEFLSPINLNSPTIAGVSSGQAAAPASTVMIAGKWIHADSAGWQGGTIWGVGPFPGGMIEDAAAEGVECDSLAQNCFSDWGRGGGLNTPGVIDITVETEGAFTAGNSFHVAGQNTIGYVDGHSKRIPYQALAVGSNFNYAAANGAKGGNNNITITSGGSYLWSLTKDCSQFIYGPCVMP
jgi:prepilin-type N-terminal cleavage/methylation domain-containing protein